MRFRPGSVIGQMKGGFDRRPAGFPVALNSFASLGSSAAVQQAASRLARAGYLVRVEHGVYARPGVRPELSAFCSASWDKWHATSLWNMPKKPRFIKADECLVLARALRLNGGMKTWLDARRIEEMVDA